MVECRIRTLVREPLGPARGINEFLIVIKACRHYFITATPEEAKKSKAGRKPLDALVLFRMLVLQALYNLSDEQIEYQVRDRLSFTRFLGLGFEDGIPDGTTLWLFREKPAQAGLIDKLFDRFDQHLNAKGYIARGRQMVDASIVPAPKPRNTLSFSRSFRQR